MKIALTGGAYEARSLIASAQRCLNLFPEPVPQGQGEPMPAAYYPTPGLNLLGTIGTGPIRGIHQGTQGNVFVVSGDILYHVDPTAWTGTSLGTLTQGLKTPVSMSDNGNELVIVDGTANGWVVELPSLNFQSIVQQNTQTPIPSSTTAPIVADTAMYSLFYAQWNGEIGSATVTLDTGYTGNLQCGIFSNASGGIPGDVLGFANVVSNPVSGVNQLSFGMSIVLAKGTPYWIGFCSDTSAGDWTVGPGLRGATSDTAFADFPSASPPVGWSPSVVVSITISNDPQGVFAGADRVDYLDTFFIFNKPNTPQFYISGSLAVTFDPLDFANKESYSDLLVVAVVAKRLLYLFGRRTTEIWYDAGPSPLPTIDPTAPPVSSFPFAAMQSEVFIDHGIVAKYSPAIYDNMVFWLTRDRQGQGIVLMVAGYETRRVSTFAIEAAIFGYGEIDDAIGFCYQLAGHSCYVLTFPSADKTWVYDISAQLWHEWCWIDANGTEHRHRANCFSTVNDILVVGDWQNGNLYALDNDVYTDNGQPIKRLRSFPHLLADGRRVFYREFLADMATGNAPQPATISTTVPGAIPNTQEIAQLIVPADSFGTPTTAAIDWARGKIYLWQQSPAAIRIYTTTVATQNPTLSAALPGSSFIYGLDVDPVSGNLIVQDGGGSNGCPIHKYDANTLALLGTYGISTSAPAYPASVWSGQALVCVAVSGVGYALLKYSEFSGVVSVIRTDTMAAAGFSAAVVSGATNNRAIMCRGASGGASGSVFLTWQGSVNGPTPTIPLYTVAITAGAETYDIATWPTTNPHITSSLVGTIAAAAVNPAWTTLMANAIGYDATDGNVLLDVMPNAGATSQHVIIKVDATTAAVIWAVPVGNTGGVTGLGGYRVGYNSVAVLPTGLRDVITTNTSALVGITMSGLTMTNGFATGDDTSGLMVLKTVYASGTNSPTPVSGTPTSFSGWAILAGVYPALVTTTTDIRLNENLISLRWSDDRGHSYGSPVTQSIGALGRYKTSLQWQRLGYARDRIHELSWSVPCKTALQGCFLTLEAGDADAPQQSQS